LIIVNPLICKEIYLHLPFNSIIFNRHKFLEGIKAMSEADILTVKELADYLKIAEKTAYRFVAEGKIPAFKVGSAWRFRKSEIERWISQQEDKAYQKVSNA
jgi:excisionase family DNA binding protein